MSISKSPHISSSSDTTEQGEEISIIVRAISSTKEGVTLVLGEDLFGKISHGGKKDEIPFINNGTIPTSVKLDDWIVVRALYDSKKQVYRVLSFVENISTYIV